jgi:hypothetical protein
MKAFVLAATATFAMFAAAAQAGVAPNSGASQMSQSGAKIAPSKKEKAEEQPQAEGERPQEKSQ